MHNQTIANRCIKIVCGIFACSFLTVVAGRAITTKPMNAVAVRGQNVTLECASSNSTHDQISWTIGGATIVEKCVPQSDAYSTINGTRSCSLVIKDVASAPGQYRCEPELEAMENANFAAQVIQIVDEPEVSVDNPTPKAGETVTITCAFSFLPVPNFDPFISLSLGGGQPFSVRQEFTNTCNDTSCILRFSLASSVVQVVNASCVANFVPNHSETNLAANDATYWSTNYAQISWTRGPDVKKGPMNMAALTGTNVTLECESDVTNGDQIDWRVGFNTIAKACDSQSESYSTTRGEKSCSLVIKDVANVPGTYSCQPAVEGLSYGAQVIQILSEPEVYANNSQPFVGQRVAVTCSFRFVPVPNFTPYAMLTSDSGIGFDDQWVLSDASNSTFCSRSVLYGSSAVQVSRFYCTVGFEMTNLAPNRASNYAEYKGTRYATVSWTSADAGAGTPRIGSAIFVFAATICRFSASLH